MPPIRPTEPRSARRADPPLPISPTHPRRILSWIYAGRLLLALALVGRWMFGGIGREDGFGVGIVVALLIGFTAGSYLVSHRRPGVARPFLHLQAWFDVAIVSGVVFLTGGQQSIFAPTYILVITAAALLLPVAAGIAVGMVASVAYAVVAAATGLLDPAVILQAGLFAVVAAVTGYLSDRLRKTGAALGEVQTELRLLRLDTDDILETIGTGILTVDGAGRLAFLNPAASEILDLDTEQWMDQPILEELDRLAPGLGDVISRTAHTRTPIQRFETEPLTDEGFVLGVSTTLLERGESEVPPVTAIFQDITEKIRAEALRRRAERLEAVAELSASLAHEIKNPLASIRSAVEQIAGADVDPEDSEVLSNLIVRESNRLSRLLGEFIDFARVKVTAPEPLAFDQLIREVVDVVKAHPDARDRNVTLDLTLPEGPILIRGAGDLLHRAVLNLTLNAVQWAGEGGHVFLRLDEVRSDLLSPAIGEFRLVRLSVRDTGPGVPEEIQENIFDPFFTRRAGGTGLGLALVHRAVEAHGGAIFVDNAADGGSGAVFSLYLPSIANLPDNDRVAETDSREAEESTRE